MRTYKGAAEDVMARKLVRVDMKAFDDICDGRKSFSADMERVIGSISEATCEVKEINKLDQFVWVALLASGFDAPTSKKRTSELPQIVGSSVRELKAFGALREISTTQQNGRSKRKKDFVAELKADRAGQRDDFVCVHLYKLPAGGVKSERWMCNMDPIQAKGTMKGDRVYYPDVQWLPFKATPSRCYQFKHILGAWELERRVCGQTDLEERRFDEPGTLTTATKFFKEGFGQIVLWDKNGLGRRKGDQILLGRTIYCVLTDMFNWFLVKCHTVGRQRFYVVSTRMSLEEAFPYLVGIVASYVPQ